MTKEQEIVLRKARKYRFAMLQYRETTQRFYKEQASHMEYMARKVKYHRALNEFLDVAEEIHSEESSN